MDRRRGGRWYADGQRAVYEPSRWRMPWMVAAVVGYVVLSIFRMFAPSGPVSGDDPTPDMLVPRPRALATRHDAYAQVRKFARLSWLAVASYWLPAAFLGVLSWSFGAVPWLSATALAVAVVFSVPFTLSRVLLERDFRRLVARTFG